MSRIIVGMSGGVDSSVTAYLLKKAGHEVIGITMRTWESDDYESGRMIIRDAKTITDILGIPYHVLDFHKEFKQNVIEYFVNEYIGGQTPNPCVMCNRHVKWNALLIALSEYNADYVATGHYAFVDKLENERYALKRAKNTIKDQTYALFYLTQEQLSKTIMPVGNYKKEEIRAIAENIGLPVADKPDSQENCFIPDGDYAGYICRYTKKSFQEGNFIDINGKILGKHKGIIHYTIGQRKGLGIAFGVPVFVTEIRAETNEVVLGTEEETYSNVLYADRLNYMSLPRFCDGMELMAKIRYNHTGAACRVYMESEDIIRCEFNEPVRAVTKGQAVVLYDREYVAGGGIII